MFASAQHMCVLVCVLGGGREDVCAGGREGGCARAGCIHRVWYCYIVTVVKLVLLHCYCSKAVAGDVCALSWTRGLGIGAQGVVCRV